MLQNLYVKNLALIDETEVEFGEGLNILTGETEQESQSFLALLRLHWVENTMHRCFETGRKADW